MRFVPHSPQEVEHATLPREACANVPGGQVL